jgi:hypothetical protein
MYDQGLFSELLLNVIVIIPASGVDLASYETLKRHIENNQGGKTSLWRKVIIRNISNGDAQFFVYYATSVEYRSFRYLTIQLFLAVNLCYEICVGKKRFHFYLLCTYVVIFIHICRKKLLDLFSFVLQNKI